MKELEMDKLYFNTKLNAAEINNALLNMIKILNLRENIVLTDPAVPPEIIIEEEKIMS